MKLCKSAINGITVLIIIPLFILGMIIGFIVSPIILGYEFYIKEFL